MKKLLIGIIYMISCCSFSQEKIQQTTKTSRVSVKVKYNQVELIIDKTLFNIQYPFRLKLRTELDLSGMFVGMTIPIDEYILVTSEVGLEYHYDSIGWRPQLGVLVRGRFPWGRIRINYGSDWYSYGVSSSLVFNVYEKYIRAGIASRDKYIGPRTEFLFYIGKKHKKSIRLHGSYFPKNGKFHYGVRVVFREWFYSTENKVNKIVDSLNPF